MTGAQGSLQGAFAARGAAAALAVALGLALLPGGGAGAFTVSLTAAAPKEIYLQVGNGLFTGGNYTPIQSSGQPLGTPGVNTTINVMSVTVAANAVGNGAAQAMTTNNAAALVSDAGSVAVTVAVLVPAPGVR